MGACFGRSGSVLALLLAATAPVPAADGDPDTARIRSLILRSRQPGAHGLGYGERSLAELSRALRPADVPRLISLVSDRELRVGAQFALASQCEAAIPAIREAFSIRRIDYLDASDTLRLVSGHGGCTTAARQRARDTAAEIDSLQREYEARAMERAKRDREENARIQKNAVILMQGGDAAQTLSRTEREEVYRRSLKAMGLAEGGPMTPQQKDLADRMYRSMVLGEPRGASNTPAH